MEKPCSCTQFMERKDVCFFFLLHVTWESVSVLQVPRQSVSSIKYCKSHQCVWTCNEIESSYDKIIITIVPSYTRKNITHLFPLTLLLVLFIKEKKTYLFYYKSHENPYQYYKSHACIWTYNEIESSYDYISITIVQSYTGKLSQVCCRLYCYECTARVTMPTATNEWYFSGMAWYYGDNDFIIRTFDFIAWSDAAHMTCSTWYRFSRDLQYLIRILAWLAVPDTDSCVTCSTDTDFAWLVVKNTAFYKLREAVRLPHWLPYISVS